MSTVEWDSSSREEAGAKSKRVHPGTQCRLKARQSRFRQPQALNREEKGRKQGWESALAPQLPSVMFYVAMTKIFNKTFEERVDFISFVPQPEGILVYHSWESWQSESL